VLNWPGEVELLLVAIHETRQPLPSPPRKGRKGEGAGQICFEDQPVANRGHQFGLSRGESPSPNGFLGGRATVTKRIFRASSHRHQTDLAAAKHRLQTVLSGESRRVGRNVTVQGDRHQAVGNVPQYRSVAAFAERDGCTPNTLKRVFDPEAQTRRELQRRVG
jgi:hypothetical protein